MMTKKELRFLCLWVDLWFPRRLLRLMHALPLGQWPKTKHFDSLDSKLSNKACCAAVRFGLQPSFTHFLLLLYIYTHDAGNMPCGRRTGLSFFDSIRLHK